jgi:hypothetical protein
MLVLLMSLGLASSAVAQEDDKPDMRAKVIKDKESGVSVTRPEGWVNGKKKSGGTIAVFRAAGDEEAQIDVLVSPLKRESAATAFFTSFHANLHKTGFAKREVRKEATYKGKKGLETEYGAKSGKRQFRLIVWQYHQGSNAIIVSGFFPAEGRDKYYADFQKVLNALVFE